LARGLPSSQRPVRFGSASLHASHRLRFEGDSQGLRCLACGANANVRARKLARPCDRAHLFVAREIMVEDQPQRPQQAAAHGPARFEAPRQRVRVRHAIRAVSVNVPSDTVDGARGTPAERSSSALHARSSGSGV